LEDLLEIVGLEVMGEGVWAGTHSQSWGKEFQIVGAATLKLPSRHQSSCALARRGARRVAAEASGSGRV